jgi:hypothetical protein
MTDTDADTDLVHQALERIASQIRVTKLVATRSVRGNTGESFAGFSAGFDSIEDKSGITMEESEIVEIPRGGLSLKDARIAYFMLSMHADFSAIDAAWASGSISDQHRKDLQAATKRRYGLLLRKHIAGDGDVATEEETG